MAKVNLDHLFDSVAPGMGMRVRLQRWFRSGPGQHKKRADSPKGRDLVRLHGGPQGLPTIREDLAGVCDKVRLSTINGQGVGLLDYVIERLSESQRGHLRRLT